MSQSEKETASVFRRILVVVFHLDLDSQVLKWQHDLVAYIAEVSDEVIVLTEKVGRMSLPAHVKIIQVPLSFQKIPLRSLGAKWLMQFALFTEFAKGFDVAFFHMNFEWQYRLSPLLSYYKVPSVIWYAHGAVTWRLKLAHRLCDRVITSSPEGFRINSSKVRVIGQGVAIDTYQLPKQFDSIARLKSCQRIVCVGRLSPTKNWDLIIRAFSKFCQLPCSNNFVLNIIGEAAGDTSVAYEKSLKTLVTELDLSQRVIFSGKLAAHEINALYQDAALHLNLSDTGSMDKTVLEALATGCPALTSNPAFHDFLSEFPALFLTTKDPALVAVRMSEVLTSSRNGALSPNSLRQLVISGKHDFHSYAQRVIDNLIEVRGKRHING